MQVQLVQVANSNKVVPDIDRESKPCSVSVSSSKLLNWGKLVKLVCSILHYIHTCVHLHLY